MQRPIELFALLDYIKVVIKYQDYDALSVEPFESIFISYSEEPVISSVNRDLMNGNFVEVLSQIHSYEQAHHEIYRIYMSIKKDFAEIGGGGTEEEITNLFQDKYGIMQPDEMAALLELQANFLHQHEYT
jgi:hypothetical protein